MSYSIWRMYEQQFCFRRAFRYGELTIQDMVDAFSMTTRSASRRFEEVVPLKGSKNERSLSNLKLPIKCPKTNQPYLIRAGTHEKGKKIIPNPSLNEPPACASEADFFRKVNIYNLSKNPYTTNDFSSIAIEEEMSHLFFIMTGLRPQEINLEFHSLINNFPHKSGALNYLMRAITNEHDKKKHVDIEYVSLNKNDTGKRIRIIPLSIQLIGEQISVYACKISFVENNQWVPCREMRTYVLSRIIDCSSPCRVNHRDLVRLKLPSNHEQTVKQYLYANEEYTPIQKKVIASELNLRQGFVTLPQSKLFQFLRAYSDKHAVGIWPPLVQTNQRDKK